MDDKRQILAALKKEFDEWEELLRSLSEEQITARRMPADLSIQDVLAHLMTWQQRSIARLEAGLQGRESVDLGWPEGLDPESEEDLEQVNAWIHETHLDEPWTQTYRDWEQGYLRLLELGEAVPERDLFDPQKYPWLGGSTLAQVLLGSYDHHHREHLEPLREWLREQDWDQ